MQTIEVAADSCDACPHAAHVKAYVYAEMRSGHTIAYCAHHGTAFLDELTRQAVKVIDLRHTIPA